MELHETRPDGQVPVEAYGDGGFRLRGAFHAGSLLILPDRRSAWSPTDVDEITAEAIEPIGAVRAEFDLLLIGTGTAMRRLPANGREHLAAFGLAFETMATGAACRTYNLLITEGRRVAAALIAVP
jgi:uncharacterized protein